LATDMRIDSHHHFWRYSASKYGWIDETKKTLQRDFLPNDLKAELDANDINGVISVQARQSVDETKALLNFADEYPWIRGVVGWVPLCQPNLGEVLDELGEWSKLRGVRHVVQDEPDDRFMLRPDFIQGICQLAAHNLVYDLLVFPHQLPAAIELADRFPGQRFVLDHIAKPRVALGALDLEWHDTFVALAKRPHVFCKFSGVITEVLDDSWTLDTLRPYWEIAYEAFGASRLMFGTDWPVCTLRGSYSQWTKAVTSLSAELSSSERARFWGQTAIDAYSLP
jgi:L-fuconolactonase